MCGIFGLIRNVTAPHPERASAAFVELGKHAVERGRDSAGFALHNYSPTSQPGQWTRPRHQDLNSRRVTIDGVTIVKDTVPFEDLWDDDKHLRLLAEHRVALGHTRWATQGKRDSLLNASPLLVGDLVGTHNGDIDISSVAGRFSLPPKHGSTDTEVLYQALSRDRRDRRKVTDVLRNIEGRAALAWLDRTRPDRVYLARAALSPLAMAWDAEGNLYWASNPRWFRDVDAAFNGLMGFHTITLVQEGVLLTVSLDEEAPLVEDMRSFTPKCRPRDARLSDGVVWRGFDPADCAADKAQKRHQVAPVYSRGGNHYGSKAGSTSGSTAGKRAGLWGGAAAASSWDMSQPGYFKKTADPVASTSEGEIPDYFDRLDGVVAREFAAEAASTDTDTLEDQGALWDEDDLVTFDEEEAMSAATRWVEEGADEAVLSVLRTASMPSEISELMAEFDLSTEGAFHRFRNIVTGWNQEAARLSS